MQLAVFISQDHYHCVFFLVCSDLPVMQTFMHVRGPNYDQPTADCRRSVPDDWKYYRGTMLMASTRYTHEEATDASKVYMYT